MKVSQDKTHLGQSVSMLVLLALTCVGIIAMLAIQSGALN